MIESSVQRTPKYISHLENYPNTNRVKISSMTLREIQRKLSKHQFHFRVGGGFKLSNAQDDSMKY